MNENINLIKILKNCPKGTKLYSTIFGEVEFDSVVEGITYSVNFIAKLNSIYNSNNSVMSNGKHLDYYDGECTLFPSKDQRDWSKFTAPWLKKERFDPKTLKAFDKVIVRNKYNEWSCTLFSHINNRHHTSFIYETCEAVYEYCIPYNNETKHLVGTKDEAPVFYRYWED